MDPRLRPNLPPLNTGQLPWRAPPQPSMVPPQGMPYPHQQQLQSQQNQMPHIETADQARIRFEVELEFVQALANPHYLNYLAQRGYFKEATFVRYLSYLRYFKQPEYAKTLKYPQALLFLDLLQKPEFREAIASSTNAKFIEDQMLLQWHYYLRKRQRLSQFTATFEGTPPPEGPSYESHADPIQYPGDSMEDETSNT